MKARMLLAALAAVALSSCGSPDVGSDTRESLDRATSQTAEAAPVRSVRIVNPAEGAILEGPDVRVELEVEGFAILPAGDTTANSGHHHLFLDEDLTEAGRPVPTVPGRIIHMGDASAGYVFEGVEPGEHRIIAVVGDFAHVPLQPWVVDTVHFVVR
jgi:hypothetical protein